jgi:YfiR/HmsC-like
MNVGGDRASRAFAAILVTAAGLLLSITPPANAQTVSPENAVKVGFVFNFLKFTQWTADAFASKSEPVLLCVQAGSDLDQEIRELNNRIVQDRSIQVRLVPAGENETRCHVKYVGASMAGGARGLLARHGVVTIGDEPRFAQSGGMINFYRDGGKLRFEINVEAARQADIYFSSDLLRLARVIKAEPVR